MSLRPLLRVSSIAVLLAAASPAVADGVLPAVATPVQREQAQARFVRGKELMGRADYDGAITEFRASHEIVASPNTRLEIARCLLARGKMVAAYAELGRVVIEAKELVTQDNRYQRTYAAARVERAELEAKLGFLRLTIDNAADDTRVSVAGEVIRRAAWAEPAPVQAGQAQVIVQTPGHQPVARVVTVAAGQTETLTVDALSGAPLVEEPPPAPAPVAASASPAHLAPWMRPAVYVSGGVAGVGLALFTAFGLMARSTYDDLAKACAGGPCPPDKAGEISSGRTSEAIANVGLVFGLAGVAAATTVVVLSLQGGAHPSGAALVIAPSWIGVQGKL